MNIEELIKKDNEIPNGFETDSYNRMTAFERFSILLKLEKLKFLTPEPEIKLEDETNYRDLAFKMTIRSQENKIKYLTQLLKDNNIIVVEG